MKHWNTYKKTYRSDPDIFDFARAGDLRGLADILSHSSEINLNETNSSGYSPLMLAVYNGQEDFCEALLRCGADVNSTDAVGNSLLMASAFKGNLNLLKLLLTYGANTDLVNKSNMTVRDWALMFKREEILVYLDSILGAETPTSTVKNMFRFIKLGLIIFQSKFKQSFS